MSGTGIMSMFSNMLGGGSNAPAAPAPATGANGAPATPGSIPASAPNTGASSPQTAANGTVPAIGTDSAPATPFAEFADLWKNEPNADGAAKTGVFGDIDPKKFMEAAGKIDFAKVVTPDQLKAIASGGEDAVKAFAAAMNSVAQTTYAQSAFASTKISEQATARAREMFLAELPQLMKKHSVSESLRAENPVFSNPAVQPIISALESQLSVKFPQASSAELTQMARTYVEALGSSFAPKPAEAGGNKGDAKGETDWSKFLE